MKWSLRFLAATSVLAVSGYIATQTTAAEDLGLDVWNVADLQDRVAAAEAKDHALGAECTTVCRRVDWRLDIVTDYIAGRITGLEAHGRFLDANRSHPKATYFLRNIYAGETDEERTAVQIIRYVSVSNLPGAEEAADRLACELAAELGSNSLLTGGFRTTH